MNPNINKETNIIIDNPCTKPFLADCFYPDTENKYPLIVFAHGYKGYKDWGTFNLMAEEFAKAGFVFVKFNFSHNGTTLDNPTNFDDLMAFGNNNYTKEMSDYNAIVDFFYKHPKVDSTKIAIMGHSRGGGNTILQAYQDNRIKALITLAGIDNFSNRFPKKERLEEFKKNGVFYVENSRTKQQMPHYYQFYEDFIQHEKELNIQFAAQHLKKPYLIIHGTNDEAVKPNTADLLHEWSKNSELFLINEANHTFGGKEPWTKELLPEKLTIVIKKSIDFLKENL
ncbi:dienelactone hydrolase family protein [Empedobacter tilapiae]|uniref:alpha/beta hydrolase family protein n=1 Tax=Empedobacter tilapiae TaxID=2491114 RepID=UPI0028D677BE|nr:dienelactone hydrolase family protein [Empedobacter tilapiae]